MKDKLILTLKCSTCGHTFHPQVQDVQQAFDAMTLSKVVYYQECKNCEYRFEMTIEREEV